MKRYFSVDMEVVKKIGITASEMMLLENIFFLSHKTGWCFVSKASLAEHHGITRRGLYKMIGRLTEKGFISVNKKGHLRVTKRFLEAVSMDTDEEKSECEQSSHQGVNKVPTPTIKKEIEEREKGESHQQRRSDKHSSPVDAPSLPDWLNLEAWNEWESYRKEKKKPITPTARKRQWAILQRYTVQEQRIIIDRSINSGWAGLFELKDQDRPQHKPKVMLG